MGIAVLTGVTQAGTGVRSESTLHAIIAVWRSYGHTIWRSLVIAIACLEFMFAAGVPLAYVLATGTSRWARLFGKLVALPIVVPGLALALGMLEVYGRSRAFGMSSAFILAGHALFTLAFMVRAVAAARLSSDLRLLEEGAVIRNAVPALLAGALTVFTLSIGEFNMSGPLHAPLSKTLPIGLTDGYASLRIEISSVYMMMFFLMAVLVVIALERVARPLET